MIKGLYPNGFGPAIHEVQIDGLQVASGNAIAVEASGMEVGSASKLDMDKGDMGEMVNTELC